MDPRAPETPTVTSGRSPTRLHFRGLRFSIGVALIAPLGCAQPLNLVDGPAAKAPTTATRTASGSPASSSGVSLSLIAGLVKENDCHRASNVEKALARFSAEPSEVYTWAEATLGDGDATVARQSATQWIVMMRTYASSCDRAWDRSWEDYENTVEPVRESFVEFAFEMKDCRPLQVIHKLDAWPYKGRFVEEVSARDFEAAEVTRLLWIDTLDTFEQNCSSMSRRDRIQIKASRKRLDRIVGLDDPTLIGLRTKMLEALESGASEDVAQYAEAIAQREKALDGANAAAYEAKLAAIQHQVDSKLADMQRTAGAPQQTGRSASEVSAEVAETTENVARSVEAGVRATNAIMSLF